MRNRVRDLLLFSVTIILCLVIVEIGLRMFPFFAKRSGEVEPIPERNELIEIITVFEPNFSGRLISKDFDVKINTNSLGFCERELDFNKLSCQRPLFFVGDSFFLDTGRKTVANY